VSQRREAEIAKGPSGDPVDKLEMHGAELLSAAILAIVLRNRVWWCFHVWCGSKPTEPYRYLELGGRRHFDGVHQSAVASGCRGYLA
jgi:hypothetical protein